MRSPSMATSAVRRATPVPSTTVPPRITMPCIGRVWRAVGCRDEPGAGWLLWETQSMTLAVQPVAGALGAEIAGVDLSRPLDDDTFDEVHGALLDHHVIFFRDQELIPDQQIAFARRFG